MRKRARKRDWAIHKMKEFIYAHERCLGWKLVCPCIIETIPMSPNTITLPAPAARQVAASRRTTCPAPYARRNKLFAHKSGRTKTVCPGVARIQITGWRF
ncbi:hypothetical protein EVAR_92548_1 [Eumeta japonica]|uniref:Uncharacterized protein n=1 Tax=Eumeta variegata TaxID=151549 RepID=A0A4C1SZ52_EUMVA|nr:hypothetical protein EVAR_92548_1 [Eumeta japonica]